jgi:hypothetical protein
VTRRSGRRRLLHLAGVRGRLRLMAERAKAGTGGRRKSAASKGAGRKLTKQQLAHRRKAQQQARAEAAEAERRAGLSAAELVAEDDAQREKAKGAARTIVNGEVYKRIMRQWTLGMSYEDLADLHGLTTHRIEQIVSDLRDSHLTRLGLDDPMFSVKFAQRLVVQRSAAVSQYARLAEEVPDDPNMLHLRLGFLKQRDAALSAFTELVQELGWLPRNLGTLNVQMDAMQMAEVLVEKLVEHGVGDAIVDDIVQAIELRVARTDAGRLALAPVGPHVIDVEEVRDDADVEDADRGDGGAERGAEAGSPAG